MAIANTTAKHHKKPHGLLKDLTGRRFSRLLVLSRAGYQGAQITWHVRCDCGTEKIVLGANLRGGKSRSCGCLVREVSKTINSKHGGRSSPEYSTWAQMRGRCERPSHRSYHNYGGRGIRVCERWQTFQNFLADMGPRPSPKHSIDRIDVNGHYEPDNCRWATIKIQSLNRRDTIYFDYQGQRLPMATVAEMIGVTYSTMENRRRRGETGERLFGPTRTSIGRLSPTSQPNQSPRPRSIP